MTLLPVLRYYSGVGNGDQGISIDAVRQAPKLARLLTRPEQDNE